MSEPPIEAPASRDATEAAARAFVQLHGRRLHGFALLLTLGDLSVATDAADEALQAGAVRASTELAHPERAAGWLRRRVLRRVRGRIGRHRGTDLRRAPALEPLGVDRVALTALKRLDVRERAAFVTSTIERLAPLDVGAVVSAEGTALERIVRRARRKAIRSAAAAVDEPAPVDGPLASRIMAIAERTLS
jgi:DNA-directed RNA polymerase specialized sigma24 family protein